ITGPSPTYKFGDQWVLTDRLLMEVDYAHVGNNFILDFHEDSLTDVQPALIVSTGLNLRSASQSVFLRPVNSVNYNANYFLPATFGMDHAFKFGAYWRDAYSESIGHTGGFATASVPASGVMPTLLPAVSFGGVDPGIVFHDFSPRLGFTYDLQGNGRTVARVNYARYYGQVGNGGVSSQINPLTAVTVRYPWADL